MDRTPLYYVYAHYRLDTNAPFYVGKGKNRRAYEKRRRNSYWSNIVNKHGYRIEILYKDLTEQEAFDLEVKAIKELSASYRLANLTIGGEGATPVWFIENQKKEIQDLSNQIWNHEVKVFSYHLTHLEMAAVGLDKIEVIEIIEQLKKALYGKES